MAEKAFLIVGAGGSGEKTLSWMLNTTSCADRAEGNTEYVHVDLDHRGYAEPASGLESFPLTVGDLPLQLGHLRDPEGDTANWLPPQFGPRQEDPGAPENGRLAARLAFLSRAGGFRDRLEAFARSAQSRGCDPHVVLIGSIAGGTGSGLLSPIAFLSREVLGRGAKVDGFALLPSLFPWTLHSQASQAYANYYAALAEIEKFKSLRPQAWPFDNMHLVSDETIGGAGDPFRWLAEHIKREILRLGIYLYNPSTPGISAALAKDIVAVNEELLAYLTAHPNVLYELNPRTFEEVVAAVLRGFGYDITLTKRSRDGGKDLYAVRRSALGEHLYIVECKRYSSDRPVGVDVVRSLYGVVQHERATMGIVATTSYFTRDSVEFQKAVRYSLGLTGYDDLVKWLKRYEAMRKGK